MSEEILENANDEMERSQKIAELEAKIAELEDQLHLLSDGYYEDEDEDDEEDYIEEERRLVHKLRCAAEKIHSAVAPFVGKCSEQRCKIANKTAESVCEHPLAFVALAFGAGFVAAKVLEEKIIFSDRFRR
ncbi:MAG: hypothetical protein K6E42_05020 [Synergistes sp.]|nr:hypothetical protein [Synergistes sp.]